MKSLIYLLFLVTAGFFFSSCEDVVQIKLDEGSKLYVIDAFVTDQTGVQTIRVTTNDTYFSNSVAPPVPDANVVLTDLTLNRQFNFNYTNNGNYTYNVALNDSLGIVDHQYQLRVTIDGNEYTALTVLKRKASIDSIGVEFFDGNSGFGPVGPSFFFCTLFAKDKTDANTDYYWVKTFRNDTLLFGPSDINVSIDGTNGPVNVAGVDSTSFTPPITFIGFNEYQIGNTCAVEVHSIAKETYYWFFQASAQINNGGLFATTPENVKTNITTPAGATTKAVGWFNMAGVTKKSIVIQ